MCARVCVKNNGPKPTNDAALKMTLESSFLLLNSR